MSLEIGRSPIRESFGCHVNELDSMLRVMGSYYRALSWIVTIPAWRKIGGRQNKELRQSCSLNQEGSYGQRELKG